MDGVINKTHMKIFIYTSYTIENSDGTEERLTAQSTVDFKEGERIERLESVFDQHGEKVGAIERKILK